MTAEQLFAAGYTDLVSVIPPGVQISAASKIDPSQLGKVPGRVNGSGTWGGYDWRTFEVTRNHARHWDRQGANIGLRADRFPAVDIDCLDPELSAHIQRRAFEHLGAAPVRIGQAPKALVLYRTEHPFGRMRLWLTGAAGSTPHLVEVLGDGQQYVVAGTHPNGRKYRWDGALPAPAELPLITADGARRFLDALADDADLLGLTVEREGTGRDHTDRAHIDQTHLRAPSLDDVFRVAALIPNTSEAFPGRDDYLRMGYAIKAAGGDEAYPAYEDWALRWEGNDRGVNEPEVTAADWARMVPPFEVGWPYLLDKAAELAGYCSAQDEFKAVEASIETPSYQPPTPAPKTQPALALPPPGAFQSAVRYSDGAAAIKLRSAYGTRFRYCGALGGWLTWTEGRWAVDETRRVAWWAMKVANAYAEAAINDTALSDRDAKTISQRLCSSNAKESILSCTQIMPGVPAAHADFDADLMALNTPAGLLDLATGAMTSTANRPLVTKRTGVAPAAGPCPRWSAFLAETTGGDEALQTYLQQLAGYCLTGLTREQILVFLWGPGGNGKSVFISTLAGVMGDYAVTAQSEVFASTQNERHPTELARMRGARLVSASESQEGRALDEQKVKQLTGGDAVAARFMNQDFFEFTPRFKLIMVGNHKPTIHNLDAAMRRRLHLVPFTQQPAVVDDQLTEKLKEEWPQILHWALEGCRQWLAEGLVAPPTVLAHTKEFFEEEDPLGSFLAEVCVLRHDAVSKTQSIFERWAGWAHERNEYVGTSKRFTASLLARPGIQRWRDPHTGLRGLQGIELLYDPGEFEAQATPERAKA